MKHLKEIYENNYTSINSFDAEDNKPFKFAVCVEITDLSSACGDEGFLITVNAAKLPKYLSKKNKESVMSCMGITSKELTVNDVSSYGLSAPLESFTVLTDKEIAEKLDYIDNQIPAYGMLCGFYFDKQVNRMGNTGWDFLNGNIG